MRRELLISAGPGEWRAAWLEDGTAAELYIERGDIRPAGSILLGRVLRRSPGLAAAFVEIGEERPGFLPLTGMRRYFTIQRGMFVLAIVVVVFAPLGDLIESLLKRDLGVKDMGSVLPGHGGVLDRIDSVLLVAPAVFYYLRLIF